MDMFAPSPWQGTGEQGIGYSVFISYSHSDRAWAIWLQRALEAYRIPKRLQGRVTAFGTIGARIGRVFRDRDELAASADLSEAVRGGLEASSNLIVVCSPRSARSRWVNEEIRIFRALGKGDRIRSLIVEGEPHAADPERECLPPALLEAGAEPLAADVRKTQDGKAGARLKIIAGILDVPYDELRQRDAARRQRRLIAAAAFSTLGFVLMAGLAVVALLQRNIARERTITAERTVSFVKSMFEVSDPSQARGETITAREILDRGARQIQRGLDDEPAVKAELGVTLGEVYGSLGLYREADRLIRATMNLRHDDRHTGARQHLALGESQARLGAYADAIASYHRALELARGWSSDADDLVPRSYARLAEAEAATGELGRAEESAQRALALDRARRPPSRSDIARDLEVLGAIALARDDFGPAAARVREALAIRLAQEGPLSPSVGDNDNTLANIAEASGDLATAERYYRRNLVVDLRVLGPGHPDFAGTLNNLAWVLLQRRRYAEARPLLERALQINLRERSETHDDLAYVLLNLAMAHRGLGDSPAAATLLERALAPARLHEHPMLPNILTDLAEARCDAGRVEAALPLLREAYALQAQAGSEAWEKAWTRSVLAACYLRAGDRAAAARLLEATAPVLRRRWPVGTHFRWQLERSMRALSIRNSTDGREQG